MGDSGDDDGDYKRSRDKFRTERRGYDSGMSSDTRGVSPGGGGRREWRDARPGPPGGQWAGGRDRRSGGGYYEGGGGGGRRGYDDGGGHRRHEMSPPAKRMRGGDWEEGGFERGGGYGGGGGGGYDRGYGGGGGGGGYDREHYRGGRSGGYDRSEGHHHRREGGQGGGADGGSSSEHSQPLMMSFKAFLATQDDTISDEDAIKKYADYKLEFKRQQLNEFFVSHKDEECSGSGNSGSCPLNPTPEAAVTAATAAAQLPSEAVAGDPTAAATAEDSPSQETETNNSSKVLNDLVLVMLMLQTRFTAKKS